MTNFSIRYKLLLSFIGIALMSVPFNIYFMVNFNKITQSFITLTDYQLPRLQALLEMKNTVLRVNLFISNFNYTLDKTKGNESTPTPLGAAKDQLLAYLGEIGEWQKSYQDHLSTSEQSSSEINQLTELKKEVILKALDVFSGKEENITSSELIKKIALLEKAQERLEAFINNQLNIESANLDYNKNKASAAWNILFILSVAASIFILLVAFFIAFILSRWIAIPIISLRNFTYKINHDNLDLRMPILTRDEIGDLAISINKMLENLLNAKTQIIEASRLAGVAEVATNVLHNVGNILTSVNTSVSMITRATNKSKIAALPKLYDLLYANKNHLSDFLNNDNRGKLVFPYFQEVLQTLKQEHSGIQKELKCLQDNLNQIEMVIKTQLSSKITQGVVEPINILELINATLALQSNKIKQNKISVEQNYEKISPFFSVKSKLQQILVNLIKNAIEALLSNENPHKSMNISVKQLTTDILQIKIEDNGIGIPKENLDQIFSFGFTTKMDGHGFGLHSCALLAVELGGKLFVESPGLHQGTTFIIELPNLTRTIQK